MARNKSKRLRVKRRMDPIPYPESDETYAYIAGYTAWGFPYGVTWEEMEWFANMESLYATLPPKQTSILSEAPILE